MFMTHAYRAEVASLDGQMLDDLASAVENLRDHYADGGLTGPDAETRVDALRELATFLRSHPDVTIEAGTEFGQGRFLTTTEERSR